MSIERIDIAFGMLSGAADIFREAGLDDAANEVYNAIELISSIIEEECEE